jgi:hypothetical protein
MLRVRGEISSGSSTTQSSWWERTLGQEQGGEGSANGLLLAAFVALGLGYGLAWMIDKLERR